MARPKISLEEEKRLVDRAKKEIAAFGELYDKYVDDIYIFILYRVKNSQEAEDITSTVFEKAMRNLKNFEWKGYTFGAWLYTIARNSIIDTYKKKGKFVSVENVIATIKDEEQELPEDIITKEIEVTKLTNALKLLPDDQKEVVYLRYVKEFSISETMEITKRSTDSVKSLAKRGLSSLRRILTSKT